MARNPLGLPETLIHTLSTLPPVFLLTTARLVCKQWQNAVETSPELRWITWVGDADSPPHSLRGQYSNRNCGANCATSLGNLSTDASSGHQADAETTCKKHIYTDVFEINPIALHFTQQVWGKSKRYQDNKDDLYDKYNGVDVEEVEDFFDRKLDQLNTMTYRITGRNIASGRGPKMHINYLFRPQAFALSVYLFPEGRAVYKDPIPDPPVFGRPSPQQNTPYSAVHSIKSNPNHDIAWPTETLALLIHDLCFEKPLYVSGLGLAGRAKGDIIILQIHINAIYSHQIDRLRYQPLSGAMAPFAKKVNVPIAKNIGGMEHTEFMLKLETAKPYTLMVSNPMRVIRNVEKQWTGGGRQMPDYYLLEFDEALTFAGARKQPPPVIIDPKNRGETIRTPWGIFDPSRPWFY
ncbi:hypothetical protein H072_8416 [Dactylellina haptotyla CBS 200.50]|uniref:F-box domain-containing protein n=1 Tax=Dactylellina haptotyla (strain CBS 200.50) TaxID=1284197 RepID=S8BF29_DACHA|nr:hypothetical protein H072_8416 [Dactylellina haptotyla CBS 200.50]